MTFHETTSLLRSVISSLRTGTTKIRPNHLDRYDFLRAQLTTVNVATSVAFQKTYSGLYQLRYIPGAHRTPYFELMEANKNLPDPSFHTLLNQHNIATGRWEISFISKLVAIIDPNQPVWDSIVRRRLQLTLPIRRTLLNCTAAYEELVNGMNAVLEHPLFQNLLAAFNRRFGDRNYHSMRILDVSIWGLG